MTLDKSLKIREDIDCLLKNCIKLRKEVIKRTNITDKRNSIKKLDKFIDYILLIKKDLNNQIEMKKRKEIEDLKTEIDDLKNYFYNHNKINLENYNCMDSDVKKLQDSIIFLEHKISNLSKNQTINEENVRYEIDQLREDMKKNEQENSCFKNNTQNEIKRIIEICQNENEQNNKKNELINNHMRDIKKKIDDQDNFINLNINIIKDTKKEMNLLSKQINYNMDEMDKKIKETNIQIDSNNQEITNIHLLAKKNDEIKKQHDEIKKQNDSIDKQHDSIEKQHDEIKKQNGSIEKQNDSIEKQHDEIKKQNGSIEKQNDSIEKQHDVIEKQNDEIEKQNVKIKIIQDNHHLIENSCIMFNNIKQELTAFKEYMSKNQEDIQKINNLSSSIEDINNKIKHINFQNFHHRHVYFKKGNCVCEKILC